MDIIHITPKELRASALALRLMLPDAVGDSVKNINAVAHKFDRLADKLDADNLDAMTFCTAKVEGVQS